MTTTALADELLLQAVGVAPHADARHLARISGLPEPAVAARIDHLRAVGAIHGRRSGGYRLSDDGEDRRRAAITDGLEGDVLAAIEDAYDEFCSLNAEFKELCTRWQLKPGGTLVLNDHRDAAYDAVVVAGVQLLHDRVQLVVADLAAAAERFAIYAARFAEAAARLRGGDTAALLQPLSESLHDLVMELHTDLLLTLGRERTDVDGD